jgi:hypothetical protein
VVCVRIQTCGKFSDYIAHLIFVFGWEALLSLQDVVVGFDPIRDEKVIGNLIELVKFQIFDKPPPSEPVEGVLLVTISEVPFNNMVEVVRINFLQLLFQFRLLRFEIFHLHFRHMGLEGRRNNHKP